MKAFFRTPLVPLALLGSLLVMAGCASSGGSSRDDASSPSSSSTARADATYSEDTVLRQAEGVFGEGAEGIGELIGRAFKRYGRPNAVIRGEEGGGALVAGLRYGKGKLFFAGGGARDLYWQSPSLGFDAGGNAAKTFIMVYNLRSTQDLFQRYPAVDGSLYFIGGAGLNYNQIDDTVLAVIRVGVGWRAGVSVGYLKFTPEASINPF
ncbi:MAG TPA: EipA family protein [Myxococcota bacterium]|nr:EipA family protein [Myxococcota bacterium]